MVREIRESELNDLLELYLNLHEDLVPQMSENLQNTWDSIVSEANHHIIVNEVDSKIVSSLYALLSLTLRAV